MSIHEVRTEDVSPFIFTTRVLGVFSRLTRKKRVSGFNVQMAASLTVFFSPLGWPLYDIAASSYEY